MAIDHTYTASDYFHFQLPLISFVNVSHQPPVTAAVEPADGDSFLTILNITSSATLLIEFSLRYRCHFAG